MSALVKHLFARSLVISEASPSVTDPREVIKVSDLSLSNFSRVSEIDWPDRTVGLGPDRTGLLNQQSGPKVKDRTVSQSPFLVQTGLKLL